MWHHSDIDNDGGGGDDEPPPRGKAGGRVDGSGSGDDDEDDRRQAHSVAWLGDGDVNYMAQWRGRMYTLVLLACVHDNYVRRK